MSETTLVSRDTREQPNPGQRLPNISLHTSGVDVGKPLSCALIGEGNLLIECGQLLRISGLRIQGVISDDPLVVRWATGLQIPITGTDPDGIACLQEPPIDYLFSIDNPRFLSADILRLPRIAAINYHNGPLPRYAGLNAPSWALFNGEKTYGITWHKMDSKIDSGDIVKQHVFAVDSNETALSLNLKCCEECISAFTEILPELARGACVSRPQDSGLRTYCPGARRPPLGGILDWSRSGEECEALARGLDFGRLFNPLLLPKIWTGTEYFVASEVRLADAAAEALPGTVLSADGASLTIATESRPLIIGGLATLDGEPLSCADVVSMHGLHSGFGFPFLDLQCAQRIDELSKAVAHHEPFWVERLREVLPVSLVRVRRAAESPGASRLHQQLWHVPAEVEEWLARKQRWQQGEFLLAAFGGFLARISFEQCFDVEFRDHGVWPDDLPPIFAGRVPFRFQMGDDFEEVLEVVRTEIDRVRRHLTYARDLVPRSPGLRNQLHLRRKDKLPLAVELGGVGDLSGCGHDLVVRLPRDGRDGLVVFSQELHGEMPWLMERFSDFIRNLVAGGDASLGQVPLMAEEERQTLLLSWSRTGDADPSSDCLHQLFESQAALSPDAVALQYSSGQLTYRELNAQADAVAVRLLRLGVGPETCVGICLERSPESIVGLLGILKAGAAYVPVDPAHPEDRLAFIMEDCGAKAIVSTRSLASRLPSGPTPRIYLDEEDLPNTSAAARALTGVTCRNLAYVIYTSGSTGEPKGVMVEHRSVVNFTRAAQARYPIKPGDRLLQFAPITFDASVAEIFTCLASGGALVMRTDEMLASAEVFFGQCASWKITMLDLSTAHWNLLVAQAMESGWPLCPTLRLVIIGGEAVVPAYVDAWRAGMGSHIELINAYGPTEATVAATWVNLDSRAEGDGTPIGKPIPGATAYVLDPFGQLMPIGLVGELHIGGAGLARGYLRRPQLTAEKFVPSPFNATAEARLYKTGDLCSWRTDGMLEFHGRIDGQVKVRGQRIELGEIEAALLTHPNLKACAVVVQDDAAEGKKLTAFVVMRTDEVASLEALRIWAGKRLPEYMIPSRFGILESLPMTSSGKVDRKRLETLDVVEMASGLPYAAPRSELQSTLVKVWQTALRREDVGIHDNFFHLGGHSLLAVAVCSKVKHLLDVEIPLRWIFDHPTIESLSERIESHVCGGNFENSESIRKAERREALPMSFAQQGMWLLQQTLPDPAAYNVPTAVHLSGLVDRERVQRSLRVILERHEVLRTGLVQQGEDLVQQVAATRDFPLPWREVNLRSASIPEQASALQQILEEEACQAFDLAQPPLWRVLWVQLAEDDQVLAFTFHHSIVDDWAMRLLFQELSRLYDADANEELAHLPELPVQYADYALWQRERLRGVDLVVQSDYWQEHLRDLPPDLDLPGDLPKPLQRSGRGAIQSFQVTAEVVARLNVLSREENATSFMTALAAYQVWLYRYTGQSDLVVATPITGRERQEVQSLIGFFLNTLPIRARMEGGLGFREILRQVRQTVMDAFEHARFPFEKMVELAIKGRNARSQPLHQVMFVFLEGEEQQLNLGEARVERISMRTGTSKCDLIFSVMASERGWDCQLEYASDIFTEEAAARMAGHMKEMLEAIAEAPGKPVDQLRLMPDSERHRLLVEWNQTKRNYPGDKCAHQIFEEQVNRAPEATALQFGDVCLSYQEVNIRANRLAHHLRSLGVAPDVLVGLCSERSVEMIVALLGILKAGGAYVPLDPKLPLERLRVLLHDINAPLVLCQRAWQERLLSLTCDSSPTGELLVLEDLSESLEKSEASDPPYTNTPGDLAYVMFTSGTTGKPKGVMVPHRGIVRLVVDPDYVELRPDDVLLQFAPLSFDASTFEIWGSLLNGAKLVLPPNESLDFAELGNAITGHRVTTLWLTAALFHQMMELQPSSLAGVRQLLAGGDILSPARVRDYLEMPGHGRLINGYGPTENTTFTCCGVFDEASQVGASVSIGRPIAGTTVYILDKQGEPVPPGVTGELYAGGDGLARGYLNAPELTQERFVADPFSTDPRARLYKTGDLARWRADGNIEFLGRSDHQVKIRGYRIELGEIEHALRCCPGVSEAVVVVNEAKSGDKQLLAYLVDTASPQADPANLRARLSSTLPQYMLPHAFVWLQRFPLTPNGKLDRNKLPAPDLNHTKENDESGQAKNLLELELICIWERLFKRSGIGRNDNFFDLGGHSLQAARLASEIDKLLGRKIPIATLFQSPTIASFARWLTDDDWAPAWSSLVPLQPSGSKPPLFLIHGWGGDVYVFLHLAQTMQKDRPIYGVQAVGLDGRMPRHSTVEEMARHYAREIRSLQPEGPYHLAGFSLGGWIAYAVAQELNREGGYVAFLGLFDTHATSHVPLSIYLRMLLPRLSQRLGVHLAQWCDLPPGDRLQHFVGRWQAFCYHVLRKRSRQELPTESTRDIQKKDQPDYYDVASALYRPKVYSGHVDFFAAETCEARDYAFWQRMATGGVEIHHVSGTHRTMLDETNIQSLAESLEAALSHV